MKIYLKCFSQVKYALNSDELVIELEEQGYISAANHVGKREINYDKINT